MARHYVVIGGGIIGLATAYQLLKKSPGLQVTLLEKEAGPGRHQSSHNSGVLHSGLYYKPGSAKALLAVSGIREMIRFCQEHAIPHEICGKLVVATNEAEMVRLKNLEERGIANGLSGLKMLSREQMLEIEPHVGGIAALRVPEEGIVDYGAVCTQLVREIETRGGRLQFKSPMKSATQQGNRWRIETAEGAVEADLAINCAGLHSDRVARASGLPVNDQIIPFRGEYYKIKPERQSLVKHLIYPVPDPTFPFLGVHFSRLVGGGVEAGPNAVLAFAREGYSKWQLNPIDLAQALLFPGLRRFMNKNRAMCWQEFRQSLSRAAFCGALQKLVPDLRSSDLTPGGAGVRAQAMTPSGELVQDFLIHQSPGFLHVLNAPSPGATASLAIGSEIVRRAELTT